MFGTLFKNVLKKKWTKDNIANFIGKYENAFLSCSLDESIRLRAASGGVVTSLLAYAISNRIIDGAIVCKTRIENGKVRANFFLARNIQELKEAQGSKYVDVNFIKEALPLVENLDGKIAIVGLPCHITLLKKKFKIDAMINSRIVFTIAIFCGHTSQTGLIDRYISKYSPEPDSLLNHFRFRVGLWRGKSIAKFENNVVMEKNFSSFGIYQNLYFFSKRKCLNCIDHFGYDADLCVGDIWSYHLKNLNKKMNCIIVKSDLGKMVFSDACQKGFIQSEEISIAAVLDGQSRTAPFHYNISSRHRAGKFFGMNIPDKVGQKVKWHELLEAYIVLFNWKWSQHPKYADLIFKIPKPILKTYLYFLKGLESLK
jgi:coenzyme F420-reducing hydrogenase beta subunit